MLIHLKHQKILPTVLLSLFYLLIDYILSITLIFIFFLILVLLFRLIPATGNAIVTLFFLVFRLVLLVNIVFIIPKLIFLKNKYIHAKFFKKYPVTPLFLIAMSVFGTALAVMTLFTYLMVDVASKRLR